MPTTRTMRTTRICRARRYVALLRGINVGGHNRVAMPRLRQACESVGCTEVTTYIQSGNVVFKAPARLASALPGRFEGEAPARYGFAVPVVARTAAQLQAVVEYNPFLRAPPAGSAFDHKQHHLGLWQEKAAVTLLSRLEQEDFQPDEYAVHDREIYLYLPAGVAGSKLLKSRGFAKPWGGMTLRNWRTVLKTLAMAT